MNGPELAKRLLSGDIRALARAISWVEERGEEAPAVLREVFPATGRAFVVGVTGFPGAGKSSLVDRLTSSYRSEGLKVGVIAVDPSSAFSGGAILGDRIRMMGHSTDPGVFIRSMATRGALGGLSRATADAVDLMDAAGYDVVMVETVGVGQDEIDIVRTADTVVVVLVPGMGDDIQAIKAGILEIADIFVINKADQPGADRLQAELETMMSLGNAAERKEIVPTVAVRGEGTPELIAAIDRHRASAESSGDNLRKRARQSLSRFLDLLRQRLLEDTIENCLPDDESERTAAEIASRRLDPYAAVERVVARVRFETSPAEPQRISEASDRAPRAGLSTAAPADLPRLDHVGIAVGSLASRIPFYEELLGLPLAREEDVLTESVRVAFLGEGETHVELLEPLGGRGAIASFLEKRGEGIHHLCFEVADIEETLERARRDGLTVVGEGPRMGAKGRRVAFLHPRSTGGILIELTEKVRQPQG